ncbi:putative membrane protein YczE [Alkalibacillus flavidus]|uniref:Membrane protein YczE n=1 Tax=Alkalibacillus flavidus TaxID=546021 RepID=A0ABV2KT86_9BACI
MVYKQFTIFFIGLLIFSYGIALAIQVQYLGIHPWDVLTIAFYDLFGLSVGTWTVIIGLTIIIFTFFARREYINIGTFLNTFLVGVFVDMFLYLQWFPTTGYLIGDIMIMLLAIITMGIGGGTYSAAQIGLGPRDGFMLSISDMTGKSIQLIRIYVESGVLLVGLVLGGPAFIFTFIFTFIQSPIYQRVFLSIKPYTDRA